MFNKHLLPAFNKHLLFLVNVPIIKETQLQLQVRRHVKEQGCCYVTCVGDGVLCFVVTGNRNDLTTAGAVQGRERRRMGSDNSQ